MTVTGNREVVVALNRRMVAGVEFCTMRNSRWGGTEQFSVSKSVGSIFPWLRSNEFFLGQLCSRFERVWESRSYISEMSGLLIARSPSSGSKRTETDDDDAARVRVHFKTNYKWPYVPSFLYITSTHDSNPV